MATPESITVEVVYSAPDGTTLLTVTLPQGATVQQAIEQSGILEKPLGIDLAQNKVGVYGKVCKLDHPLVQGDRVEIYRPLIADPKTAKKKKAAAEEG